MSTQVLIRDLAAAGVKLELAGDKLRVHAPSGALTNALRGAIGAHKEALLAWLREDSGAAGPVIPVVDRSGPLPLSSSQQRLWFLDQMEEARAAYNIPLALRLGGRLDLDALRAALDGIVARHEVLRTCFEAGSDGLPRQRVLPPCPAPVTIVDLCGRDDAEAAAAEQTRFEAARVFDLARPPLLRGRLVKLASDDHLLLLTVHHIAADGWSLGVLVREFAELYGAHCDGRPASLPVLSLQYGDYAAWQRDGLERDDHRKALDYWERELAELPPLLELPTDRPRPAVQSYRGATVHFELPRRLADALKARAGESGATPFMVLLAAFQLVLSRYAGQADVAVGTPVANRGRAELEGLVGFFVNTLVLRTRFDGLRTFRDLLAQVKETALGAYAHQGMPFEALVERLQPGRSLAHAPLFQVLFALQNAPLDSADLPGLSVRAVQQESGFAKFDLDVSLQECAEGLRGTVEFAVDLFDRSTVEALLGHYRQVLEAVAAAPERALNDIGLLSPAERRQQDEWNATEVDFGAFASLSALFEAQAAATPDAAAVMFGAQSLSYRELNERANRLAHRLRALGVGPDVPVGLCGPRTPNLLVGLLAILKAGGAYLPLDPGYPLDRLAFALDDAQVRVLLTGEGVPPALAQRVETVLSLDSEWNDESGHDPALDLRPDHLAYLIYTSGSTGRPKGVAMEQGALVNLIRWQARALPLAAGTRVLQFASINFDVSFQELFSTWTSGGTIVLADADDRLDPARLLALIESAEVQRLFLPVVMLQHLAEEAARAGHWPASVRAVITAGEALVLTPAVRRWFQALPECALHNHYGPSETHVVTAHTLTGPAADWPERPCIGRPVANTFMRVLDRAGQPAPVGVPGELFIGGACLARGYLGRPDLTAERFVADPFGDGRLYRSGDLARWSADGTLELLGRTDHQVKIRGFRVELSEIEAVLEQHPGLRQAVVVARELNGEKALVAYVVGATDGLRGWLAERLPDFMLPAAIVALPALPLTPSGKINRLALPEPTPEERPEDDYAAPASPLQQSLCELFAAVLKRPRVGIHDNFFEIGGHSLLAAQVVARVREQLGLELSVRQLFQAPTVAGLAEQLADATAAKLPPIVAVPREPLMPASWGQQRLWFLDRLDGGSATYNMPMALRLEGSLDADSLRAALNAVADRHEILRARFVERAGEPWLSLDAPVPVLSVEDANEAELTERVEEEAGRGFDLGNGPLWRARLLRLASEDHVLLLTLHHSIGDGWSLGVLFRELTGAYRAMQSGSAPGWAPLPIQYADYATWQRLWLSGDRLQDEIDHWHRQLRGLPPVLRLPTDHPRPAQPSFRGGVVPVELSPELLSRAEALAAETGGTVFMVLMAAFSAFLARVSGQTEIAVGSALANRPRSELEALIGYFANIWVLRSSLEDRPSFRQLLQRTRAATLDAHAHGELPFEQVVEAVAPARDSSYSPLFQALFILHNTPETEAELSELRMRPLEFNGGIAKHDLSLNLWPRDGGLRGWFEYARDLFEPAAAATLSADFIAWLPELLAAPDRALAAVPAVAPEALAEALNGLEQVHEAAVLTRAGPLGEELVAYVVQEGPWQADAVHAALLRQLPGRSLPHALVPVSRLPRRADGAIDSARLLALPIADDALAARWEAALSDSGDEAAVVVDAHVPHEPVEHLGELLPGWRRTAVGSALDAALLAGAEASAAPTRPPAYASGGPLSIPEDDPVTFTEALLRTAARYPERGIHYLPAEGPELFLSYAELLDRARRVLGGLRALGLQPGDRAVLQIKALDRYFPVFWACVLGGITPVTVAVPAGYRERNGVVNKLLNIWQLLDRPVILAQDELVEGLAALGRHADAPVRVQAVGPLAFPRPGAGASGATGRSAVLPAELRQHRRVQVHPGAAQLGHPARARRGPLQRLLRR